MEAFYFGDHDQLFGIYHEANHNLEKDCGVIICNPLGQEYIRSYKAIQKLAIGLSEKGYHVLRFDYSGTGDSYNYDTNTLVNDLLSDIKTAITEIIDCTGVNKVVLIGLRYGASLAALIASTLQVDKVVFWNPVLNGEKYLKELLISHKDWLNGSFAKQKKNKHIFFESNGFEINEQLHKEINSFNMAKIDLINTNKLLFVSSKRNIEILNKLKLMKLGDYIETDDIEFWVKKEGEIDKSLVPIQEIDSIIKWLD